MGCPVEFVLNVKYGSTDFCLVYRCCCLTYPSWLCLRVSPGENRWEVMASALKMLIFFEWNSSMPLSSVMNRF